jgi:ParB-like chromosome segregation protein Spo0J
MTMSDGPKLVSLSSDLIRIPDVRLRSRFAPEEEEAFKASVKADGVLQPLQVVEDPKTHIMWLVDGEHRLREVRARGDEFVQALVRPGTLEDAVVGSAKHNLHRGRVNPGDLAEYLKYIHEELGWPLSRIGEELQVSKGYASKLIRVAGNPEVLLKLKRGEITVDEAYATVSGGGTRPKPHEGVFRDETVDNPELETTGSLREALQTGKRYDPSKLAGLSDEDLEEEKSSPPRRCDYCGQWMRREDFGFIIVHKGVCLERAMEAILEATMNPRPQPEGEDPRAGEHGEEVR